MHNLPEQTHDRIPSGRLKKRPEFLLTAQKGKKWVADSVVVQSMETDSGEIRFGYTATKKIGNAVVRNRAKRRLRAAVDTIQKSQNLKSADIVFIARDIAPTCDWDKLQKDMIWCLKRLGIIEKDNP